MIYKVFQYNRKDLFLQAPDESFVMRSFNEIPHEVREWLSADLDNDVKNREIEILSNGELKIVLTLAEIAADRLKKQEIAKVRGDIAAIEATGENIPDYAMVKLKALRKKLAALTPVDPTAVTQEQQRANESIIREDFDVKKSGYR